MLLCASKKISFRFPLFQLSVSKVVAYLGGYSLMSYTSIGNFHSTRLEMETFLIRVISDPLLEAFKDYSLRLQHLQASKNYMFYHIHFPSLGIVFCFFVKTSWLLGAFQLQQGQPLQQGTSLTHELFTSILGSPTLIEEVLTLAAASYNSSKLLLYQQYISSAQHQKAVQPIVNAWNWLMTVATIQYYIEKCAKRSSPEKQ